MQCVDGTECRRDVSVVHFLNRAGKRGANVLCRVVLKNSRSNSCVAAPCTDATNEVGYLVEGEVVLTEVVACLFDL